MELLNFQGLSRPEKPDDSPFYPAGNQVLSHWRRRHTWYESRTKGNSEDVNLEQVITEKEDRIVVKYVVSVRLASSLCSASS